MKLLQKTAIAAALATVVTATPSMGYEKGDFILRVGPAGVFPTDDSDSLEAVPGGRVEADSAWSLGLSFSYLVTDNIGVGVLGAYPFTHDIKPKDNLETFLGSDDRIGKVTHLPPTLTLQYHFDTGTRFHPYIGAGINYTYFWDEETKGGLGATGAKLDVDDSWGPAAEIGVDYLMDNDWTVGAQLFYISIEPDAEVTGGSLGLNEDITVKINPWVFMASVGRKF